ncbi:MAG: TIGR02444 family protein [Parvularculaceae bacterium]
MSQEAFWNWSQEAYARPGAAAALIRLQDEAGLNVNVALWCAWRARAIGDVPEIAIRCAMDAAAPIGAGVTQPLRAARRALRPPPPGVGAEAGAALYETLKAAELDAERLEQAAIVAATSSWAPSAATADEPEPRARRALAVYGRIAGAARRPGFSVELLSAVAAAIFPRSHDADEGATG